MSRLKLIPLSLALILGTSVFAQLNIPLADVSLAYPSISSVTVQLGSSTNHGLPTPFIISGNIVPDSLLWFCLDPLQTIYYNGSGEPVGSKLHYASTNPSDFDKWTPSAPGLTAARKQNLADLFTAYAPTTTNQLIAGALQIAVWEIVNEFTGNSFNLSSGQVEVTGNAAMISTAQNMLNSLSSAAVKNKGNPSFLDYLIDGSYTPKDCDTVLVQDLVGWTPPSNVPPIPESGSFAIGAIALLLPAVFLKLRRRTLPMVAHSGS